MTNKRSNPKPSLCHPDKADASRGMCQPCYKKWLKLTPKADRPYLNRSDWKKKPKTMALCHPSERGRGHGLCQACYIKWYREQNVFDLKEKAKAKHLKSKYGLTPEAKREMLRTQGGVCAICKKTPASANATHVDHDHKTGRIRGILCNVCNWYLGKIDADPAILERINTYREAP